MDAMTPLRYQPAKALWPHQEEALARMKGKEAFALMMAMRTGKTPTVLAEFGQLELEGKASDLMVIAPAGLYRTWATAINEHCSKELWHRLRVHIWKSGSGAGELRERRDFLNTVYDGSRVLLMNIEALSLKGNARDFTLALMNQEGRSYYVAIDESTTIKNKSKRTDFIIKNVRPRAKYRRILSGLPTPRSPLDLYYQYAFLDERILNSPTYIAFTKWAAFTMMRDFGGRWLTTVIDKRQGDNGFRPEAIAELKALTEPYSYRVEFRPKVPSTYSIREVELTDEQRRAYNEVRDFATTKLANDSHVTATVVIAQITRMHQILMGHVKDENDNEQQLLENRTQAVLDELAEYHGKAIIWFVYVQDLERVMAAIEAEYGLGSTARFYGGNTNSREDDEVRFKTDPNCRFMGATAGAGGRGRTWDNADLVLYHSSSDDLEKREQSEQRPHGRDKEVGIDYVDFIAPGTVEMKILQALRKKINMSTTINGDNYKDWLI